MILFSRRLCVYKRLFKYLISPSNATICRWAARFQQGDMSVEDEECPKLPKLLLLTIPRMVAKVTDILLRDQRMKVEEIVKSVDMPTKSVRHILLVRHSKLSVRLTI